MERLKCPACGKETLKLTTTIQTIPYFGEILLLSAYCENCKFKHSDVFSVEQKEPACYKLTVEEEKDLNARVIRSSSGTIEIPELGIKMEPGPASQGFITNVEGILLRMEEIVKAQKILVKEKKKLERLNELEQKLNLAMEGRLKLTIVLKDPLGNSAILSRKAKKRKLSKKRIGDSQNR